MTEPQPPTTTDALVEVAHALNRIARAIEGLKGGQSSPLKPAATAPGSCEKCGSPLEEFEAKDGNRYRRCTKAQRLYKAGTPEEGHHFSKVKIAGSA